MTLKEKVKRVNRDTHVQTLTVSIKNVAIYQQGAPGAQVAVILVGTGNIDSIRFSSGGAGMNVISKVYSIDLFSF